MRKIKPTIYFQFMLLVLLNLSINAVSAQEIVSDSLLIEKVRTESGVDPTRIQSRVAYTFITQDMAGSAGSVTNRAALTLGVNRWSFNMKYEVVSVTSGIPGGGFSSGFGDVKFNILNAFYVKDKHVLAVNAEFSMPTGGLKYGTGYYTTTPALTYSYTINQSLFLAVQPQYTFALLKDPIYPDLSILTVRIYLAKFTKTGYFFVFEPRPIFDLKNNTADLSISPIVGKTLGGGFNLIGVIEFPTRKSTRDTRGVTYQFGINKSF